MLVLTLAAAGAPLALPHPVRAHGGALVERICGPSECVTIADGLYILEPHEVLGRLRAQSLPPPAPVGPYLELDVRDAEPGDRAFFVPRAGLVRMALVELSGHRAWLRPQEEIESALRRVARAVEPFPPPRFDRVFVGAAEAADPERYARLYDAFPPAPAPPATVDRVRIVLRSTPPSPWSDGEAALAYVPASRTLLRGEQTLRPPSDVVSLLERPRARTRRPTGTAVAAVAVALLAVSAAAAALLTRRLRWKRS